jgi:hypothetical protein
MLTQLVIGLLQVEQRQWWLPRLLSRLLPRLLPRMLPRLLMIIVRYVYVRDFVPCLTAAETIPDLVYMVSYPLLNDKGTPAEPKFDLLSLLDLKTDVNGLHKSLHEANKVARVAIKIATSQNVTDVLSQGCKVLHYSGHVRRCFEPLLMHWMFVFHAPNDSL